MIFRNFLENMYGSVVQVKAVAYLLEENVPTSEREMAKILNVSHVAVNRAFKRLQDLNLASPSRVGSSTVWELNKKSYAYAALDLKFYASCKPMVHLKQKIKAALGGHVKSAIIFGSVAEGKESPSSDIDLLIIPAVARGKRIAEICDRLASDCLVEYGNRLSPSILSEKELERKPEIKKASEKGIVVL